MLSATRAKSNCIQLIKHIPMKRIIIFLNADVFDVLKFDTENDAKQSYTWLANHTNKKYSYMLVN